MEAGGHLTTRELAPALPLNERAEAAGVFASVAALTTALRRGDDPAWRRFHELYFARLLRYLLVVTGGQEDLAAEALQQTMLRAVRHVRRFEAEDVFWSWLTVLARSAAVDEIRRQSRRLSFLERLFATRPAPPTGTDAELRLHELLDEVLADLDDAARALLERKYHAGESVRHIAGALGTSEKAIESRLGRIRRDVREQVLAGLKHD